MFLYSPPNQYMWQKSKVEELNSPFDGPDEIEGGRITHTIQKIVESDGRCSTGLHRSIYFFAPAIHPNSTKKQIPPAEQHEYCIQALSEAEKSKEQLYSHQQAATGFCNKRNQLPEETKNGRFGT